MRITHTGRLCIQNVTKMHPDDVLELLESGKVVSLGDNDGREYLLFYSPNNEDGMVAVVSARREVLISVQDTRRRVPYRVTQPTRRLIHKAKRLLSVFCFEKITKGLEKNNKVTVRVRLFLGNKMVYETEMSKPFSGKKMIPGKDTVLFFKDEFQRIIDAVQEVSKCPDEMRYLVSPFDFSSQSFSRGGSMIRHTTLVRFLSESCECA